MRTALIGEVRLFVHTALPPGWHACDGRALPIAGNQPLFSLLGWRFGGDGWTTFRVPAFDDEVRRPAAVTFGIVGNGLYPTMDGTMTESDHAGEIRLFAGKNPPAGWVPCDGRKLPIAAPYLELYAAIGATYGGGGDTFAVPDLWSVAGPIGRLSYVVAITGEQSYNPGDS